jgi:type I restriction enzyme R subunit
MIYLPPLDGPVAPPEEMEGSDGTVEEEGRGEPGSGGGTIVDPWPPENGGGTRRGKRFVVNGVPVTVVAERIQYYGPDGRLITESLKDYTRKKVAEEFTSLDEFLMTWSTAEKKEAVVRELEEHGVLFDALAEEVGRDYDAFDLVCHVAFGQPPLTRKERAEQVRKRDYFTRFGEEARAVLDALLDTYAAEGLASMEDLEVLRVHPFPEMGTPIEIIRRFGSKEQYLEALRELEQALYSEGANAA